MGLKNRNMATDEAGLNAGRGSGSFWSGRQEGFPPVPLILVSNFTLKRFKAHIKNLYSRSLYVK